MDEQYNELERNVGYVVKLIKEHPGEYDIPDLIVKTRVEHRRNPLSIEEIQEAISKAEEKNLIREREIPNHPDDEYSGRSLHRYFPVS